MTRDGEIWDQLGSLTLRRDAVAPGVDLPPLPDGHEEAGPLRMILRRFLEAPEIQRERMTLRLENGQSFNAPDIVELLMRDDCPVK